MHLFHNPKVAVRRAKARPRRQTPQSREFRIDNSAVFG